MAEIKFYQDAEKTVQIYPEINPDGNYPGVTVGLANNLISPDGSDTDEYFTFRPTGGTTINPSEGYATIKRLKGNATSTTISESLVYNLLTTGVTAVTVTASTFKTRISESGTYNFIYTPLITYSSSLINYFNKSTFAKYVNKTTGTYTFTYQPEIARLDSSNIITAFNSTTFATKVNETTGTYIFNYDGSNWLLDGVAVTLSQYGITAGSASSEDTFTIYYTANSWYYSGSAVSMTSYGITTTGSESIGDTIIINYTDNEWQLNDSGVTLSNYGISITAGTAAIDDDIQIVYVAEQIGTIVVAHPTALRATGLNVFDKENNVFTGFTLNSSGNIVSSAGQSVGFFKCLGSYTYTVFDGSSASGITRAGFTTTKPTSSSTGLTILNQTTSVVINGTSYGTATNTNYKKHYNPTADGWIVVAGPTALMEDLCCHLTWDQTYDDSYENYWTYDFTIDYTDENGTLALPYGLVKVDSSYQDEMDFENGKIYRNVDRIEYSAANLSSVQARTTHYIYDSNYIYYGIDTITSNMKEVSSAYPESDFGTEEFLDTDLSVQAAIFYQINLRDKLRNDVEIVQNKVTSVSSSSTNTEYPSAKCVYDLDTALRHILGLDVNTFSTTSTYAVGDYVVYNRKLWKCTTAVSSAGAWTGTTNWTESYLFTA